MISNCGMNTASAAARRQGLVIIPVLVTLVLVTLFTGILMKQVSARRAEARAEGRRMQAEWLAESGLARASARLFAERSYRGETWDVPADELGGRPGVVRIVVETVADRPAQRRVRAEADYPREGVTRARMSKTLTLELKPETPGGPA
jgi:hypothetical protein